MFYFFLIGLPLLFISYKIYKYKSIIQLAMSAAQLLSKGNNSQVSLVINDTQKSCLITYNRLGCKYYLNVPYDRSLVPKMTGVKVFLIMKSPIRSAEKMLVDITQQPGIPYLLTPKELGGIGYSILDTLNDEVNEVPEDELIDFK
jgi:hypothetical protein